MPSISTPRLTRLPNGLRVVSSEMPHMASVCLGVWIAVGSRHETAGENGIAHFLEHLLFKGTARRSAREIACEAESLGAQLNAFTGEEHTCCFARGRAGHARELLDILADMTLGSTFPAAEVRREREVIREECAMYLDEPQHQSEEALVATLWPGHPLGRPIEGTSASLDRITRRSLLRFRDNCYHAGNMVVAAAGNLSHADLVRQVSRRFKPRAASGPPSAEPAPPPVSQPRIKTLRRKTAQAYLALGFRTCPRTEPARHPLRLLNALLGESMSSRLFQILREQHGLAYSVQSSVGYFADTGDLTVTAGVDSGRVDRALKLIQRELRRLKDELPSPAELRRARDYVIGQFDLYLEGTENRMTWLGETVLGWGNVVPPATVRGRLAAVRAADIRHVAREYLRPERAALAMVGPAIHADRAKELLSF